MKIDVYAVSGKLDKSHRAASDEYLKRLSRYCKIKLHEIKDEKALEKKLKEGLHVIDVFSGGEEMSSEQLSNMISALGVSGISEIAFVLGAQERYGSSSFSLTYADLNVQIQSVMICEQIYRAYRIMSGEPYHK